MQINPANDRILVEPIEIENKTSGGIVLSSAPKVKRLHGKVLAVGPGRQNAQGNIIPVACCAVGDTVIYGNVNSTLEDELEDGTTVLLIVADAIVGVLE